MENKTFKLLKVFNKKFQCVCGETFSTLKQLQVHRKLFCKKK